MGNLKNIIIPSLLFLLLNACATIKTMPDISLYGEADPEKESQVINKYEERGKIPKQEKVKVLVDTVPEGVSVSDGQISAQSGYAHEIIGRFSFRPDFKRKSSKAMDGFSNYKSAWRKAVCYPQVALRYATLGMWTYLSPTAYLCHGSMKQGKNEMIDESKKITKAAGGNVTTISYIKDNDNNVVGAVGYAIKLDPKFKDNFKTKKATLTEKKTL